MQKHGFFIKKQTLTLMKKNIKVLYHKAPTTLADARAIIKILTMFLKEIKPDGIVAYTHYANILGCIAAKKAGIKNRVATVRNPVWTYPKGAKMIDKIIGSLGYYSKIIAVSEAIKDSCKHYPESYKKESL